MRILVASPPAAGHFNPLTGPAVRLKERGHDVRWYAGPDYGARAQRLGFEVIPYREAIEITADNLNQLFPERRHLKGRKAIEFDGDAFFAAPVRLQFRDIRVARAEFPFDALLVDGAFYAAYLAAKVLDVPVYALGSIAAPSTRDPHGVTPFFGLRPPRTIIGRAVNRLARAMILSGSRKGVETFNGYLAEEGLAPISVEEFMDCTLQPDVARRVFAVGIPELEFPGTVTPPNVTWIGAATPHRPSEPSPPDALVENWPGPVVVVSQGTVDNAEPEKLLIPTMAAFAGTDVLVIAATGGVGTEALRERYPQGNIVIQDYVDFDAVFSRASAYVTNGGLGGVLIALTHGVPLLTAGTREGKGDINARLAVRGLALDLRTERASTARVRRGVRRVLADTGQRARVEHVQNLLTSHDSVAIIERGIGDDIEARTSKTARQNAPDNASRGH